ncbi:MAG: metallophosphoesterase [Faecalibacillus sp.]
MRKKIIHLRNAIIILLVLLMILFCIDKVFNINSTFHFSNITYSDSQLPIEFNNFSIAFISDLNIADKNDLTRTESIIKELNQKNIDMILFGGDIYDGDVFEQNQVIEILKSIKSKYGKFAVTGEKDQVDLSICENILTESGFEILHNEIRNIYYNNTFIQLIGLENNGDCSQLVNENNAEQFQLAFVHQPDYFDDVKKSDIQLQLSGHTMGGYIKIPFIGGINTRDLGEKYISGKHISQDTTLIISDGFNKESNEKYRILTKDTISIVTLQKK